MGILEMELCACRLLLLLINTLKHRPKQQPSMAKESGCSNQKVRHTATTRTHLPVSSNQVLHSSEYQSLSKKKKKKERKKEEKS